MALGALSRFPSLFPEVATPLLIAATVDLGVEAFARPRRLGWARGVGAAVSAVVLVGILVVLTNFTLLTTVERVGLLATVWLGASVGWFVVSLPLGAVGLEATLAPLLEAPERQRAARAAVILVSGVLTAAALRYLLVPAAFIGGR